MYEATLSENGIIYISAGFDGPFILQAFTVRKSFNHPNIIQLCLTDGKVYIGARYNSDEFPEVQDYWILKISAKFTGQNQPLYIFLYLQKYFRPSSC